MLSADKLVNGLKEVFEKGLQTKAKNAKTKETEAVHSQEDIAGFIIDAILDYVKDAEIAITPGPFLFPNPSGTPPTLPDSAASSQTATCDTIDSNRSIIESALKSSFSISDPGLTPFAASLPIFAATLTNWSSSRGDTITGITLMAAPPGNFTAALSALPDGSSLNEAGRSAGSARVATLLATAIHNAFKSCSFTGFATTANVPPAAGPVSTILS